ncbi:hypothetical protein BDN71DRAFT_1429939 [Pleurotus eryngii]|uniref:Uncharacterized protein n=1 Tax=Pleurotus eryngii TaxID=5323 RepID=A0A9P5ZZP7_PLEER|nr:hypothetical protein BDN71DRAFT_1429939 [Pleurotus eryngii]
MQPGECRTYLHMKQKKAWLLVLPSYGSEGLSELLSESLGSSLKDNSDPSGEKVSSDEDPGSLPLLRPAEWCFLLNTQLRISQFKALVVEGFGAGTAGFVLHLSVQVVIIREVYVPPVMEVDALSLVPGEAISRLSKLLMGLSIILHVLMLFGDPIFFFHGDLLCKGYALCYNITVRAMLGLSRVWEKDWRLTSEFQVVGGSHTWDGATMGGIGSSHGKMEDRKCGQCEAS